MKILAIMRTDLWSLTFLFLAMSKILLFFSTLSLWQLSLVSLFLTLLQSNIGPILHNHYHYAVFKIRFLNTLYESLLFFLSGVLPKSFVIHHNFGHHTYYLHPQDDVQSWIDAGGRPLNRWHYTLKHTFNYYPWVFRLRDYNKRPFASFLANSLAPALLLFWLATIEPHKTCIILILPMLWTKLILFWETYHQHRGLVSGVHETMSRNLLIKWYNFYTCNLGFHTAHHLQPGMHWSQLPLKHESVKDKIPFNLIFPR